MPVIIFLIFLWIFLLGEHISAWVFSGGLEGIELKLILRLYSSIFHIPVTRLVERRGGCTRGGFCLFFKNSERFFAIFAAFSWLFDLIIPVFQLTTCGFLIKRKRRINGQYEIVRSETENVTVHTFSYGDRRKTIEIMYFSSHLKCWETLQWHLNIFPVFTVILQLWVEPAEHGDPVRPH